jgi:CO/xanthine dehydrogenase Mo-binding subunit
MGLGTALYESVDFADGQVTNANLGDYMVPSAADLPELTHELVEREGAEVHGLGETALPPVPAAIGNALASVGAQLVELPMTAEAVLAALDERGHPEPPPGSSVTGNSARVGDETVTKA